MSSGLIELIGSDVFCSISGGGAENRLALGRALVKLQGWSRRYDDASRRENEGELSAIGREMFAWLIRLDPRLHQVRVAVFAVFA